MSILFATAIVAATAASPSTLGALSAAAALCCAAFVLWPWAVLPVSILGGSIAGVMIGGGDVATIVMAHAAILSAGGVALLLRMAANVEPVRRSAADLPMLGLTLLVLMAAVYGLALGNPPRDVLVGTYQIVIIPLVFWIAVQTLAEPRRQRAAALLYLVPTVALTVTAMATSSRTGGLVALLGIPPLIVLAGRTRGWSRAGFAVVAGLLLVDVALSMYRALWLAATVALGMMLIWGGRILHRGIAATVTVAVAGVALLSLGSDLGEHLGTLQRELQESSGYRGPESAVGLSAFAEQPLVGGGLGQSVRDIYLPDFTRGDVGPVYHAFYVTVLANIGILGLISVIWPLYQTIRDGFLYRDGMKFGFAALTCGFLVGAAFAGPTAGHWELGLLPALTLITGNAKVLRHITLDGSKT
ncbi:MULTISPECIES: O-antigen ligase family protein [unclassified Solwaraspora]|uniref:O-antigen ligase family protein n=1 Tax=unclassified Solwaraspora TaxID=2627926 RepID=UPI00259BDC9C|nr:O-antigen ligase family protein [Solwaraspora sp. WMMA2056]WJK42744.1 O-antigen ligase family protein [Solwaraspora sp. WMMA2056]